MNGIHIRLPFGLGELWLEWRERSVGIGHRWNDNRMDLELFCGRLHGCYSKPGDRGALADLLRQRKRDRSGRS